MSSLYQQMLEDEVRMRCWKKAIRSVVRPDDVVVDIGSAMGTFSLFAAQAGARKVYGIEAERIVDVSLEAAARAGLDDRVRFLEGYSTEVKIPERADVLIFEDFTSVFLHSSVGTIIRDGRKRFLKRGGTVIPQSADIGMAPFEDAALYASIDAFGDGASNLYGFDLTAMREMAVNSVTFHVFQPGELLAKPASVRHYDLRIEEQFDFEVRHRFAAKRNGTLHGIAFWFNAQLAPGIRLYNAPGRPATIWQQGVLPVEFPTRVRAGERIDVAIQTVRSKTYGFFWNWTVRVCSRASSRPLILRQSTFRAEPLPEGLAHHAGRCLESIRRPAE